MPFKYIKRAVDFVSLNEIKKEGEITVVLCSDEFIHKLNIEYLNHDYTTDVITFEIEPQPLIAEIYISVDTAKMNAEYYNVSFRNEIIRLAIHGTLHLAGYDDCTDEEKKKMTELEDYYLNEFKAGK